MDAPWSGAFSQHTASFETQPAGSQNHEDWEEWLRWDPTAAEATSPEDGTFNSGSSKNDSPLQEPLYADFGRLDDEPLQPPLIVGESDRAFQRADTLSDEPFLFDATGEMSAGFLFNETASFHGLHKISKLDTNTALWHTPPHDIDSGLPSSALTIEQPQLLHPAVPLTTTTPSFHVSPDQSNQNWQSVPSGAPDVPKKRGGRKRKAETQLEKASPVETEDGETQDGEPMKKTSHNVIEKRYRNNLNDKIVELRNSVPSLRAMGRANGGDGTEDLGGLTPAHKLNKATVMAKATEYIRHLEKRNKNMADEMAELKAQLARVEAAIGKSKDRQGSMTMSMNSSPVSATARPSEAPSASQSGVPSFLAVPQDPAMFGQPIIQQQYMQRQGQPGYARPPNSPVDIQDQAQLVNGKGRGLMSKVMMGTMAGIMVMEGFHEQQQPGGSSDRSLFSIPTMMWKRSFDGGVTRFGAELPRQDLLLLLKLVTAFSALLYIVLPLLSFTPRRKQRLRTSAQLPKAPSLASPVEVRRKAWDTAIQTVWAPKHFLLEVVAVGSKMLQLSLRRVIGSAAFTDITGTTKEEEAARIKAWDIAIDAQLAGGDAAVSYYRLLLTLMESGTLPDSPARLMQKAVHFRVFFWEVANAGYGNIFGFKQFTEKVGRFYWESARRLQKDLVSAKPFGGSNHDDDAEVLPDHLACLVELDCEEVLSDEMIQRAWNLAWNKPSAYKTVANAARDSVVEDHAIRSPLDAVAAWYSNTAIDDTLADALSDSVSIFDTEYYLGLALSVAPPASSTHVRALVAKAVLSNSNRDSNIVVALEALPVLLPTGGMNLVNHAPASPDVRVALTLAKLTSLSSPSASKQALERAFAALDVLQLAPSSFTILSSLAAYRLLRVLASRRALTNAAKRGMEELAGSLRVWVGTSVGLESGLGHEGRAKVVRLCLQIARQLGGWDEKDSGYGSAQPSHSSSPVQATARPALVVT